MAQVETLLQEADLRLHQEFILREVMTATVVPETGLQVQEPVLPEVVRLPQVQAEVAAAGLTRA